MSLSLTEESAKNAAEEASRGSRKYPDPARKTLKSRAMSMAKQVTEVFTTKVTNSGSTRLEDPKPTSTDTPQSSNGKRRHRPHISTDPNDTVYCGF